MFCHKCGSRSLEGSAFCQKCGAKLITGGAEVKTTEIAAITHAPMSKPQPTQEPRKRSALKTVLGIVTVGLAVVFVIGVFADDPEATPVTATVANSNYGQSSSPEAAVTSSSTYRVGDTVPFGNWEVALEDWEFTNNPAFTWNAASGETFLLATFTVRNVTDSPRTFITNYERAPGAARMSVVYDNTYRFGWDGAFSGTVGVRSLQSLLSNQLTSTTGEILFTVSDVVVDSNNPLAIRIFNDGEEILFNVRQPHTQNNHELVGRWIVTERIDSDAHYGLGDILEFSANGTGSSYVTTPVSWRDNPRDFTWRIEELPGEDALGVNYNGGSGGFLTPFTIEGSDLHVGRNPGRGMRLERF